MAVSGSGSGNGNGEVVVYEYGDGWDEMARMSGSKSGDILGMSVRFSEDGDSLVAGGAGGYLKVLRYDSTTSIWKTVTGVQAESSSDWVVGALDYSGYRMVVGFPLIDEVKVYDWMEADQSWLQVANTLNATRQGDGFGQSVDISQDGSTIVIGTDTGNYVQVFYYHHRRDIWSKHGSTIRGMSADKGLFGQVVSISNDGTRIAAGSPFYDASGSHERGSVRVYDFSEEVDQWQMVGDNMEGLVDQSVWGFSVALSGNGNHVAVGAPGSDTTTVKAAGLVRVYVLQEA
jgi:WD40 repeat protein